MIVYLVRHGQDDNSVRGGWSSTPLTEDGIRQSENLAEMLAKNKKHYNISQIYSSDLTRAMQTAHIIAGRLLIEVKEMPQFREVNNGILAGMKNDIADKKYPGLYWRKMGWDQKYPGGESPSQFYLRIKNAWLDFIKNHLSEKNNVLIVTHMGVINIIEALERGKTYSNSNVYGTMPCCSMIAIDIKNHRLV